MSDTIPTYDVVIVGSGLGGLQWAVVRLSGSAERSRSAVEACGPAYNNFMSNIFK